MEPFKILFACTTNSYQPAMAHSIMEYWARCKNKDWQIKCTSSRAWDSDNLPEKYCVEVLKENGLELLKCENNVDVIDFASHDIVLCMNLFDLRTLRNMADRFYYGDPVKKVGLLGSYIGQVEDSIIYDPFPTCNIDAYRYVFAQITKSSLNFIDEHK